jgi:hypothetical protein
MLLVELASSSHGMLVNWPESGNVQEKAFVGVAALGEIGKLLWFWLTTGAKRREIASSSREFRVVGVAALGEIGTLLGFGLTTGAKRREIASPRREFRVAGSHCSSSGLRGDNSKSLDGEELVSKLVSTALLPCCDSRSLL